MIRVLHVLDSLEISGGVQGVVMNTYRKIDRSLVQFDFAVYDCPSENCYREEIESLGGHIHLVGGLGASGLIKYISCFRDLLTRHQYDAVHSHNLHHNGIVLAVAKYSGVPIRISHSHQSFDERNQSPLRKGFAKFLMFLNKRVATQLVACSDKAAEFLYGKTQYFFLPNAIETERYSVSVDTGKLREELKIEEKTKIILHIGRLCPPKNHFFDIGIMKSLQHENVVLLLVGSGELEQEVRKAVTENHLEEKIRFLGLRRDIPELLKMADIAILPSLYEGLPLAAVEVQAARCPCLISDVITRQADLNLGLLSYLPLGSQELWAQELQRSFARSPEKPDWDCVKQALCSNNFDSNENRKRWYELYSVKLS